MDDVLVDFCLLKLDAMIDLVAGLTDDEANARPVPGANTAYMLVSHCLGMSRNWSSTVNLGVPVPRDRDAEFVASGPVLELVARARGVREQFAADARSVPGDEAPAALPARLDLRERPWARTTGGVLLHVFEELCQHLGHLEVTRDVVQARS